MRTISVESLDGLSETGLREHINNLIEESSEIEEELRYLDREIEDLIEAYEKKFEKEF